jgi:flagellar protein FliT
MNAQEMLKMYENVANITDQMLQAALDGNWELLVRLEADCTAQASLINNNREQVPLANTERLEKIRIIKKILSDDRQIRDLVEPRMNFLSDLMRSSRTHRQVSKAYQQDHRGR